jgi:energy-coupling factor transporter ATP-binding protein EcfA2
VPEAQKDELLPLWLAYTKPFKGSPRFHTWSILSVSSGVLERRTWLSLGGLGRVYPNQFIVLCGGPGTGKSTTSNLATSLIKDLNKVLGDKGIKFGPDKMTPAALIKRFKTTHQQIEAGGLKFEQSAMYLHSTELSTMIEDIGGGSLAHDLLKLYDCDDYFEKELAGEGIIKIFAPCANFLSDTTPSFLSGYLPREKSGMGLTARMIFATEMGAVEMDEDVPHGDVAIKGRIMNHLLRMQRMVGEFRMTDEAKAFFRAWFGPYREKMFAMHDGAFMRHFYARKPTHIRKVAMVLSAGRSSDYLIQKEDIEGAMALIDEAEPFMDKSFGVKDMKKVDDATKVLLDLVPWHSEISKADLQQALVTTGIAGSQSDFDGLLAFHVGSGSVKVRIENTDRMFYRRVK